MCRTHLAIRSGGKLKFYPAMWNGLYIRLCHPDGDPRRMPIIHLIEYYWDNDIAFDMRARTSKMLYSFDDKVNYHWELKDLDGKIVTTWDNVGKAGDGSIEVSSKGFPRNVADWQGLKQRAVVLGNLHPHKQYLLWVTFTGKDNIPSTPFRMASLTVDDRGSHYFQIFLVIFAVLMTVVVGIFMKACGVPTV